MSMSQRVLAYAGCFGLLGAGLGLWVGSTQPRALATALPGAAETKIAAFDVFEIAEKMFLGDKYAPLREKALKEKQDQRNALQAGLSELQQRIIAAGQESAEGKAMIPTYQVKAKDLQDFEQKANGELQELSTLQFNECYRLAVEAAQSIAKQQGYTHLFASKMGPLEFRAKELQAALQEVLARPVLMAGSGDDITALVKKELKVEDKPAETKAADPKGADPKADAPKSEAPGKK